MKRLTNDPDSNWDEYDNGKYVMSVAKGGTGCSDSIYGDYGHFTRMFDYSDKDLNILTDHGYKIYKKHGGKREMER